MKVGIVHLTNSKESLIFIMPCEYMDDIDEYDPMKNYDMLDEGKLALVTTLSELTSWLDKNEAKIDYEIEGTIY